MKGKARKEFPLKFRFRELLITLSAMIDELREMRWLDPGCPVPKIRMSRVHLEKLKEQTRNDSDRNVIDWFLEYFADSIPSAHNPGCGDPAGPRDSKSGVS